MKKIVFILFISFLISQICLGNPNITEQQDKLGVSIIGSHNQKDRRTDYITATFLSPNVLPTSSTGSHTIHGCITGTLNMTHVSENAIIYGPEWDDREIADSQELTSPHSFSATFSDWSFIPSGVARYNAWTEIGAGNWQEITGDVMITNTVPEIFELWPPSSDRGRAATVGVYTDNLPVTFTMDAAPFGLFITDTSTMITSSDYSTNIPGAYYEVTFNLPQTMATGDWILYMMFTKDTFKYNINKTPFPITVPPASPGDLIISEIMQNPNAVADDKGEWFEIFNGTDSGIDINGWTIRNEDYGNSHTIFNGGPLTVPSQGFLVLGNNDDSNTNGEYTCDYDYGSYFALGNSDDEIILETPGHTVIDIVEWDGGTNWPNPDGASMAFTGGVNDDNNNYAFWTTSNLREPTYTGTEGDLGSPGTIGTLQTLPVELSTFFAVYTQNENGNDFVTVNWSTASETDVHGFNIYRSEYDDFSNVGNNINFSIIPGHGSSSDPHSYSFEDITANVYTTNYYWLEVVDYGATSGYHGPVKYVPGDIDGDQEQDVYKITMLFSNYPNPVTNYTTIEYQLKGSVLEQNATIKIYNILGELVQSVEVSNNKAEIDVQDLSSGIYFYQLKTKNFNEIKKMLIIK